MTTDPAELLRIWQPVIDLARELAYAEDDPEEYMTDIAAAVYDAEAKLPARSCPYCLNTEHGDLPCIT